MNSKSHVARLIRVKPLGESMREVGVLVLIFVPLNAVFEFGGSGWLTTHRISIVLFFTAVAIAMSYLGIRLETEPTVELEAKEGGDRGAARNTAI
jgi:hypothetical protein